MHTHRALNMYKPSVYSPEQATEMRADAQKEAPHHTDKFFQKLEKKKVYPLTRYYYENNSLRVIFSVILRDFVLSKCPDNKDIFKELRVRCVIF